MAKFEKYRMNLRHDGTYVYSYETKVAEIDHSNRVVKKLGYWSPTTSKHINYAALNFGYKVV